LPALTSFQAGYGALRGEMTATAQLNILDELYMHLDREDEPWSVHIEVELAEPVDPQPLAEAIKEAAARHPIARARLGDSSGTDFSYEWVIEDVLADPPLSIVDGDLDQAREAAMNHSPALDRVGPFEVVLVNREVLLLNLHHAAGDGMGALRLLVSILRAYAGEEDPDPPVDPLAVRSITDLVGAQGIGDRITRIKALVEHVARFARPPMRIAPQGGDDDVPGYGFETLHFGADEVERIMGHRVNDATANDVLVAALGVTAKRWNEAHDEATGRAALMMPVNLRPKEWRFEVIANFASYVTVHLAEDELDDLGEAVTATADRTRQIKDDGIPGLIVDLLVFPTALPTGIKQRLQQLIPLTGNVTVDTAVLSNLGKLDAMPGGVERIAFTPPGRMPLGASLGVATLDGEMWVTLRYRHALFDAEGAREFAKLYRDVLL
jgi:NRPS condensation-like uncharacterized protein